MCGHHYCSICSSDFMECSLFLCYGCPSGHRCPRTLVDQHGPCRSVLCQGFPGGGVNIQGLERGFQHVFVSLILSPARMLSLRHLTIEERFGDVVVWHLQHGLPSMSGLLSAGCKLKAFLRFSVYKLKSVFFC